MTDKQRALEALADLQSAHVCVDGSLKYAINMLKFETVQTIRTSLQRDPDVLTIPRADLEKLKITDEWLGEIGFKWHQEERQPTKHWSVTLGWGAPDTTACMEDLCMEVARYDDEKWFCWLRKGTRFSDKTIHVRMIKFRHEVEDMITALTGTSFKRENFLYGNFYNDKTAERIRAEYTNMKNRRGV